MCSKISDNPVVNLRMDIWQLFVPIPFPLTGHMVPDVATVPLYAQCFTQPVLQ